MKSFKKTLRLLVFLCLIVLAALGVGLSGGVPIPTAGRRDEKDDEQTELVESEEQAGQKDEKL